MADPDLVPDNRTRNPQDEFRAPGLADVTPEFNTGATPDVKRDLRTSYIASRQLDQSPDDFFRTFELAKRTGVPYEVAQQLPAEAGQAQTLEQLEEWADASPILAEYFAQRPESAAAAAEMLPELKRLERAIAISHDQVTIDDLALQMTKTVSEGRRVNKEALEFLNPAGKGTVEGIVDTFEFGREFVVGGGFLGFQHMMTGDPAALEQIQSLKDKYEGRAEAEGVLGTILHAAVEQIPLELSSLLRSWDEVLTGAVAGGLAGAASGVWFGGLGAIPGAVAGAKSGARLGLMIGRAEAMFVIEAGHAWNEFLDVEDEHGNKIDPEIAKIAALGVGTVNAGLEYFSASKLLKLFPSGKKLSAVQIRAAVRGLLKIPSVRKRLAKFIGKLTMSAGLEGLTEGAQEISVILGQAFAEFADDNFAEENIPLWDLVTKPENIDRISDAAVKGAAAYIGLGGSIGTVGEVLRLPRTMTEAKVAEAAKRVRKNVGAAVDKAPLAKKSPELMQDVIDRRGGNIPYQITPKNLALVLQAEGMAEELEKIGVTEETIADANRLGLRVRYDSAAVQAKMDRELGDLLMDASDPMGASLEMGKDIEGAVTQELEKRAKLVEEATENYDAYRATLRLIRRQISRSADQARELARQIGFKETKSSAIADKVVQLIDAFARKHAYDDGIDLNHSVARIFVQHAERRDGKTVPSAVSMPTGMTVETDPSLELAQVPSQVNGLPLWQVGLKDRRLDGRVIQKYWEDYTQEERDATQKAREKGLKAFQAVAKVGAEMGLIGGQRVTVVSVLGDQAIVKFEDGQKFKHPWSVFTHEDGTPFMPEEGTFIRQIGGLFGGDAGSVSFADQVHAEIVLDAYEAGQEVPESVVAEFEAMWGKKIAKVAAERASGSTELYQASHPSPTHDPDLPHPARVGTRKPTSKKEGTPRGAQPDLVVDIDTVRQDPVLFDKLVDALKDEVTILRPSEMEGTNEQVLAKFLRAVTDNLLWVHDLFSEEVRERARKWYDGANRMATEWSGQYNQPLEVVSGILAVLSPQKNWFLNVSQAERILDIWWGARDHAWDGDMQDKMENIYRSSRYDQVREAIAGKTLQEVDGAYEKAAWIRVYDEVYNEPYFRVITPEGFYTNEFVMRDDRVTRRKGGWGSLGEITKAVSMLQDPSADNISDQVGDAHKVRSFYSNILEPGSTRGDVTMDTHAIAAAILLPIGADSRWVQQNFNGSVKGVMRSPGKSDPLGIAGLYAFYAEAYRRAAKKRDVLPREMQSITWEAIRGLFTTGFKTKGNIDKLSTLWEDYREGRITRGKVRSEIVKLAEGITEPDWVGSNLGVLDETPDTSYEGKLSGLRLSRRPTHRLERGTRGATARSDSGAATGIAPGDTPKTTTFFSGVGTIEHALGEIIKSIGAVEFSEEIADAFVAAHGSHVQVAPVQNADIEAYRGTQYFHASPVCKCLSDAKLGRGEQQSDRETAGAVAFFIGEILPPAVSIENVPKYRGTESLAIIKQALINNGYQISEGVYDAADFGAATHRKRYFLRALRDGTPPPGPAKTHGPTTDTPHVGWFSTVEDMIDDLEEEELAPWQLKRLPHMGIDINNITEPVYVAGGSTNRKTIPVALGSEPSPTIKATPGEPARVIMPDGRVLRLNPRALARISGFGDELVLPDKDSTAQTVVGNGIPPQLTQALVPPLLDKARELGPATEDKTVPKGGIRPAPRSLDLRDLAKSMAEVNIHSNVSQLTGAKGSPRRALYKQAKEQGNIDAAVAVIRDLIKQSVLDDLRAAIDPKGGPVYIIPVIARETAGTKYNALPHAYAQMVADELGGELVLDIYKAGGIAMTEQHKDRRARTQSVFNGLIPRDGQIILVDDQYTTGRTMYSLLEHVRHQAGNVVATTAITSSRPGKTLVPTAAVISKMHSKSGLTSEEIFAILGYGETRLTSAEISSYNSNGAKGRDGFIRRFGSQKPGEGESEQIERDPEDQPDLPKVVGENEVGPPTGDIDTDFEAREEYFQAVADGEIVIGDFALLLPDSIDNPDSAVEIAAHNAKVEIATSLWEAGDLSTQTLAALKDLHTELFSVDKDGQVSIDTKGKNAAAAVQHLESVTERNQDRRFIAEIVEDLYQADLVAEDADTFDVGNDPFEWAIAAHGTTDVIAGAGYALPDGTLLDFSETREGGDPGSRSLDHRSLDLPKDPGVEGTQFMRAFINLGAMRLDASGSVDLSVVPTPEQMTIIENLGNEAGEIVADLRDGSRMSSIQTTNARKAVNLIRRFYAGEDLEIGEDVSEFRQFNASMETPRGSTQIFDQGYLISLFDNANLSTVLHELGHVFLEETRSIALGGTASEQSLKDWDAIKGWLGITDDTKPITKIAHERWARTFEAYLLHGKAPTLKVESAFQRFKEWMTDIYSDISGISKEFQAEFPGAAPIQLTEEVAEIFDRMLGSRAEIDEAIFTNSQHRLTRDEANGLGLAAEEFAEINRLIDIAIRKGKTRIVADREAELPDLEVQWKQEIEENLEQMPIYRALSWLREHGGLRLASIAPPQDIAEQRREITLRVNEERDGDIREHDATIQASKDTAAELKAESKSLKGEEHQKRRNQIKTELAKERRNRGRLKKRIQGVRAAATKKISAEIAAIRQDHQTERDIVGNLRKHGPGVVAKADETGILPDVAAAQAGYIDTDSFLLDLATAQPKAEVIRRYIRNKTLGFMNSIPVADAMIDTKEYSEAMDKLNLFIRKRTKSPGRLVTAEGYRDIAIQRLELMPMRGPAGPKGRRNGGLVDARPFVSDHQQLHREERNLLGEGLRKPGLSLTERSKVLLAALKIHHQARVAQEKVRLAREYNRRLKALKKRTSKLTKLPSKGGKGLRIEWNHWQAIRALSNHFNITGTKYDVAPLASEEDQQARSDIIAEAPTTIERESRATLQQLAGHIDPVTQTGPGFSDELLNLEGPTDINTLNLHQFAQLEGLINFLDNQGKAWIKKEIFRGAENREGLAKELHDVLQEFEDRRDPTDDKWLKGKAINLLNKWRGFSGARLQLLYIIRMADGFQNLGKDGRPGPWETKLYDRIEESFSAEQEILEKIKTMIEPAMEQLERSMIKADYAIETGVPFPGSLERHNRKAWKFENILAVALNMGNRYQIDAMTRGFNWGEEKKVTDPESGKVTKKWIASTDGMHQVTAMLTKADWQAIQQIWNALDWLWPQVNSVHKRRFGYFQEQVKATPIEVTTADGHKITLEGGYYPMKFDATGSRRQRQQDAEDELLNSNQNLFPTVQTFAGFMNRRTDSGGKPLRLDLRVLTDHISHTARYIAYTETMTGIAEIISHKEVAAAFDKKLGPEIYDQIMPALQATARPVKERAPWWDQWFLNGQRSLATKFILGLNPSVAAKQAFSVFGAINDVGLTHFRTGFWYALTHPWESRQEMLKQSRMMSGRSKTHDRDIQDQVSSVASALSPLSRAERRLHWPRGIVRESIFVLIRMVDAMTVQPVWWSGYHKAMAQAVEDKTVPSPEALAREADKTVAASQPTARPFDLSAMQRDQRGIIRILSMFMTFTMKFGNRSTMYNAALGKGKITLTEYLWQFALERILPPILMTAVMDSLVGNAPEEDEDYVAHYLVPVATYQFAGLPLIREIATFAAWGLTGEGFRRPTGQSPVYTGINLYEEMFVRSVTAMESDDDAKFWAAVRAWADLLSYSAGIPASRLTIRLAEGIRQVMEEEESVPTNVLFPNPELRERR